jgi:PAS domain-containing protein
MIQEVHVRTTNPEQLRADAEGRLQAGSAPSSAGWTISAEALSLLYRLSSDPESSADALKLLHELQTYQVELDLQLGQRAENEQEMAAQLTYYQALYELAPVGYLVLGRDGRIHQCNQEASRLFGLHEDCLKGQLLTSLLSPESRPALMAMLEQPGQAGYTQAIPVKGLDSRPFRLVSGVAPQEGAILVLFFSEGPAPGS